jgi:hypothetical protein
MEALARTYVGGSSCGLERRKLRGKYVGRVLREQWYAYSPGLMRSSFHKGLLTL